MGLIDYFIKIVGGSVTFGLIAIALRRRFERNYHILSICNIRCNDDDDDERDGEHPSACCIAVACCLRSTACCEVISLLSSYAFTWCKKAAKILQAATSLLRLGYLISAFNIAFKLFVVPLGRCMPSIVEISFCIACLGVKTVQLKVAGVGSTFA